MTPYYDKYGCTFYLGDSEKILPTLGNQTFDAIITDPPFGIGFKYNSHKDTKKGYIDWLWPVIESAESLLNPGSPCLIWQAMTNVRYFGEWFPRDFRIFAACKNFAQFFDIAMQHSLDPIVTWWTEGEKYKSPMNASSRDWYVSNQAVTVAETWSMAKEHPCPRPEDLCEYLVKQFVRPRGTVIDPFLGSGTTALAAIRKGRKCVGIEKDEDYLKLAVRRVEDSIGNNFLTNLRKQVATSRKKRKGV